MRHDDAVETFKRHIEYEESATQTRRPRNQDPDVTVPEFTRHSLEMFEDD